MPGVRLPESVAFGSRDAQHPDDWRQAETTSATANAYSSRAGGLIAYKGDSTLFVDPTSLSMLVIDGKGVVARVMSVPRPNDAQSLIGGPNGTPAFDGQGRLVYRGPMGFRFSGGPDI